MRYEYGQEDLDRFWSKVDKNSENECWNWVAGKSKGYGMFSAKGVNFGAHRFSYCVSNNNYVDNNLLVLHSCDNPSCVNPNHLRQGTAKENIQDAIDRNRFPTGEKSNLNKVSELEVEEIRKLYSQGETLLALSRKFKIGRTQITRIVEGKSWRHDGGKAPAKRKSRKVLKEPEIKEIRRLYDIGIKSQLMLSKMFSCSRETIRRIVNRIRWKDVQ